MPAFTLIPQICLEPRDGSGRQSRRKRTKDCGQGFLKIALGNAFQIKPGQQLLDRFGLAQIRRQDRRSELHFLSPLIPISYTRNLHGDGTDPGHNFALRQLAISHNTRTPSRRRFLGKLRVQRLKFSLERLFNQLPCPEPDQVLKRIGGKSIWIWQGCDGIPRHLLYLFLCGN